MKDILARHIYTYNDVYCAMQCGVCEWNANTDQCVSNCNKVCKMTYDELLKEEDRLLLEGDLLEKLGVTI